MQSTYRVVSIRVVALFAWPLLVLPAVAQETDFVKRQKAIQKRFEERKGRIRNKAVHQPPMIEAESSDLGDDQPVLGIHLNEDARAYPLTMLFGGGGIFELLNDTCGGQPIAASW